jgi:hypothetical protein
VNLMLVENMTEPPLETWFLTWGMNDDRRDSWVRIQAPSKDDARTFVVRRYGRHWGELVDDVSFNPDLYPDGEIGWFQVQPEVTA